MKSQKLGKNIFPDLEVLNVSMYGLRILVKGEEFFLPYERYPWFKTATIEQLPHCEISPAGVGLHWPDLDVDLAIESLRHPEKFPLLFKN